jgi:hypothetical protein
MRFGLSRTSRLASQLCARIYACKTFKSTAALLKNLQPLLSLFY